MTKKVLFIATVVKLHIEVFHIPYLKWFKDNGYEVHVCATNDYDDKNNCNIKYCDKFYDIKFDRNPLSKTNFRAYKQLKNIIHSNDYDIIHCHTPVGGVIGRMAAKKARQQKKIKVIYTAHGFHFYKGAPLKNWMLYYPVEKILSRHTDCIITINDEDYNLASKKFKSASIKKVDGVGIDLNEFKPCKIRKEKIKPNQMREFTLIYVAELSKRKNQKLLIDVVKDIEKKIPQIKLLLVGQGSEENNLKKQVSDLDLVEKVSFLGFRKDVSELMKSSDIAISTSKQEGLPVNIIEAMATALPVIVTDCRGNRDLVENNYNGFVVKYNDSEKISERIFDLYNDEDKYNLFSKRNIELSQRYSIDNITKQMKVIYLHYLR